MEKPEKAFTALAKSCKDYYEKSLINLSSVYLAPPSHVKQGPNSSQTIQIPSEHQTGTARRNKSELNFAADGESSEEKPKENLEESINPVRSIHSTHQHLQLSLCRFSTILIAHLIESSSCRNILEEFKQPDQEEPSEENEEALALESIEPAGDHF